MASEGRIVQLIHPLLALLEEAKSSSVIDEQLHAEIKREATSVSSVLARLAKWESELRDELGALAQQLNGLVDGDHQGWCSQDTVRSQLDKIRGMVATPLELPQEANASSSHPSTSRTTHEKEKELHHHVELDPDLQKMLSFLAALFPENSAIKKRTAAHLWETSVLWGPVSAAAAESLFAGLIDTGLLQPIYRKHNMALDGFTLLDPALYKILRFHSADGIVIMTEEYGSLGLMVNNIEQQYIKLDKDKLASGDVAALQLGWWQWSDQRHIEVDNTAEFNRLLMEIATYSRRSLRYLSLQGISKFTHFPTGFFQQIKHCLLVLDLRACHKLESLPEEIGSLMFLDYLDVSGCYLLDHMPGSLRNLEFLRVLKGFVVGGSKMKDRWCRLSDLSRLRYLKKLTFIPPPNLEKLDLRCFPGSDAPAWLSPSQFPNLHRLYIRGGMLCRLDSRWWTVKILRLRYLNKFAMEESELSDAFPRLKYIEIHECSNLNSTAHEI